MYSSYNSITLKKSAVNIIKNIRKRVLLIISIELLSCLFSIITTFGKYINLALLENIVMPVDIFE